LLEPVVVKSQNYDEDWSNKSLKG